VIGRADAKAALDSAKDTEGAPLHSFKNVMQAHYNMIMERIDKVSSYFMN